MTSITEATTGLFDEQVAAFEKYAGTGPDAADGSLLITDAIDLSTKSKSLLNALYVLQSLPNGSIMLADTTGYINNLIQSIGEEIHYINSTDIDDDNKTIAPTADFYALQADIVKSEEALVAAFAALSPDTSYGAKYVVNRSWALNQPMYSIVGANVEAANSLFNCFGKYRAVFLEKPLSQLTFFGENGRTCSQQCANIFEPC
jgi:hypothetical protein